MLVALNNTRMQFYSDDPQRTISQGSHHHFRHRASSFLQMPKF